MKFPDFFINQFKVNNFRDFSLLFLKLIIILIVAIEIYDFISYQACLNNNKVVILSPEYLSKLLVYAAIGVFIFLGIKHFKKKGTLKNAIWTFLIISTILFAINGSIFLFIYIDGPYWGKVVDADTGEPIEGAAITGSWRIDYVVPGFWVGGGGFADARSTVTGKNGYFFLPMARAVRLWPFSKIYFERLGVYKYGYDTHPPDMCYDWNESDKVKWMAKLHQKYPEYIKLHTEGPHTLKYSLDSDVRSHSHPKEWFDDPENAWKIYFHIYHVNCKFYKPSIIKLNKAQWNEKQQRASFYRVFDGGTDERCRMRKAFNQVRKESIQRKKIIYVNAKHVFPEIEFMKLRLVEVNQDEGSARIRDRSDNEVQVYIGDRIGVEAGQVIEIEVACITLQNEKYRTKWPVRNSIIERHQLNKGEKRQ